MPYKTPWRLYIITVNGYKSLSVHAFVSLIGRPKRWDKRLLRGLHSGLASLLAHLHDTIRVISSTRPAQKFIVYTDKRTTLTYVEIFNRVNR